MPPGYEPRPQINTAGKTVHEQSIEHFIGAVLTGDAQRNALEFAAYLRTNEMVFERGKGY